MEIAARLGAACAALVLCSCAVAAPGDAASTDAPRYLAPAAGAIAPRVALVLSGGGLRGFAHVGVLKALESAGLRPDLVVGTSAGAIAGALYASGLAAAEVEAAVARIEVPGFTDVRPGLGLFPGSLGLFTGERLRRFVDAHAKRRRIEEFPIRFAAVATDLATGEAQVFNAGDVGLAVGASSAAPGIFAPVEIGGRLYVDGQLSSPIPVQAARRLGASVVIAVDVIYPPRDGAPRNAAGVLFQAFIITVHRLKDIEAAQADFVLAPQLQATSGQYSLEDREWLVAAGERAARAALPQLKAIFERGKATSARSP